MDEALELARLAMSRAYAPYSKYQVGAVVRAESGKLYPGCNVENAAYPQGCCAEASALSAMVMAGERRLREVWIMGRGEDLITPCGGCRQRLREFGDDALTIYLCRPEGVARTVTLGELFPLSFGPEHLT